MNQDNKELCSTEETAPSTSPAPRVEPPVPAITAGTVVPETEPQKVVSSCSAGGRSEAGTESDPHSFVYALGTIEARFPTLAIEKEFTQAAAQRDTANLSDGQFLYHVLSAAENHYLARAMCYVFTVENLDAYILQPRSEIELKALVEAIKPEETVAADVDVVIGDRGPLAPADFCNGLQIPIVVCDQIYAFNTKQFIEAIPKPAGMKSEPFRSAAQELFSRIMQLADNVGALPEHRALNYLALRYPAIYAQTMEMFAAEKSLASVDVLPSRLSGARTIVQVVFTYVDRKTDVTEKYFVRVDVSERYPFLVSKLQQYFDRVP